ncbi:MAG: YggS family pyridoxal phosphate-dependent enzyme [Lachnospiraceae bacterium]
MVKQNLEQVEKNILAACRKSGRSRDEVTLIAVSKTKPVSMLQKAYDLGIREFGENKAQELEAKYKELPADINWHMIGHLQRNKIKYIIRKVSCIHSVDSFRLAEAIEKEAEKNNCIISILIEVNVANESSKDGVALDQVLPLIEKISKFPHITIKGLMTIAPLVTDGEQNREVFSKLRKLFVDIASKNIDNVIMSVLSMGMTNDYIVAIEEGATMVRVGTGVFGDRNYTLTN